MTNTIAVYLGIGLLLAIGADYLFYGPEHLLFLAKKGIDLLDWVAVWR
ncbi:MAG: hypothetical protein VXZ18_14745 [Pseudomonadota bacterium]|nr:hypothetical protein [Thalassococcus sp.]MBO6867765.1 hypothetical protein [Thalassococcus sp.]MEC7669100.1 hypothetical protein [Pseudomonadota bacterium]MEC8582005.1 hypothetical protein [Pseudomonadota bacterium]MEE3360903.1 hypothetical protein [Pseudomonadota bacterium]